MTITIAAVMYSRVESKPENTSLKSAKYPAGPVTYALSPPVSAWAMDRISSIRGASSSQPLPSSATLIGTTTCNARPSSDGIGPRTLPLTSWMPVNRLTSAAALAWSAVVTGPSGRSYTTRAGNTSEGANRLASSTTWVDSALFGSQADESFCWALFSFPASGHATAITTIQNPRTTHLVRRPLGKPTIRRIPPITLPSCHTPHHRPPFIATPPWPSDFLMTAISRAPDTPLAPLGPLVRLRPAQLGAAVVQEQLGERAGPRRRNIRWETLEPFQVHRGSAHASSRAIEATLLPGAAAQVAGMITASRAGNPLGDAGPARTVAGEGNGRDVARDVADLRNRSRPGRLGVRDRLRGDHGAGAVAGSTPGASLRRGRRAWRFRGGRNRRTGGVPPSGQDRSRRMTGAREAMPRPVPKAEIVSRTGCSLPVDQADAVARRISGYIAVHTAEDTR